MIDIIIIILLIVLIVVCFALLKYLKDKERNINMLNKANKDRIDLESITKNIEETYQPVNIKLTSYEQEQENNAIISYDELVSTSASNEIKYDESYTNNDNVEIKKVNLNTMTSQTTVEAPKLEVNMMSYEKEEAFLKALKQLQSDLAR